MTMSAVQVATPIGLADVLESDVTIRNTVLMGSDYYESSSHVAENDAAGTPRIGIGPGAVIDGAIIDKNCRIGAGARIVNDDGRQDFDADHGVVVRDGVIVVPKNTVLPPDWRLA